MPNFGRKKCWFGNFWAGIWKQYCHIWDSYPYLCTLNFAKFGRKRKMPKFGTNIVIFGYFWSRNLKNYCHVSNQDTSNCIFAKFCVKKKLKFVTKNACFEKILSLNLKTLLPYLIPSPLNLSNCKLYTKTKMPKFGTENALFGYFSCRSSKHYCLIWNQHRQLCLFAEFFKKTKMPGIKNELLCYFWVRILKNYCHIRNQHPHIFPSYKTSSKIKNV